MHGPAKNANSPQTVLRHVGAHPGVAITLAIVVSTVAVTGSARANTAVRQSGLLALFGPVLSLIGTRLRRPSTHHAAPEVPAADVTPASRPSDADHRVLEHLLNRLVETLHLDMRGMEAPRRSQESDGQATLETSIQETRIKLARISEREIQVIFGEGDTLELTRDSSDVIVGVNAPLFDALRRNPETAYLWTSVDVLQGAASTKVASGRHEPDGLVEAVTSFEAEPAIDAPSAGTEWYWVERSALNKSSREERIALLAEIEPSEQQAHSTELVTSANSPHEATVCAGRVVRLKSIIFEDGAVEAICREALRE